MVALGYLANSHNRRFVKENKRITKSKTGQVKRNERDT